VPIIGGDGWESEKLIEIGGDAMNGCYYANHWSLDQPNAKLQAARGDGRGRAGCESDGSPAGATGPGF
jgi:branched-chain amino acid transport system substrate-binding protein